MKKLGHRTTLMLLLSLLFFACNSEKSTSEAQSNSLLKGWQKHDLGEELRAFFPEKPSRKVVAVNQKLDFIEHVVNQDSISYSVNQFKHKALKTTKDWEDFLEKELLDLEIKERRIIDWKGYKAVSYKAVFKDLHLISFNVIVKNQYILNAVVRQTGSYPDEKLVNAFLEKIELR